MSSSPALLKAVSAGRPRQVRLLLDSGVPVNDTDELGQTPLIRAIFIEHSKNREKIVRMLLKRGCLVGIADVVGRTALLWSCLYGRSTEVGLILDSSVIDLDLNRTDINGQTALFHAVTSGNAAVAKMIVDNMLKYGLTVDVTDYTGLSPLMQAMRLGHDICASILIHHGKATAGLGARYPNDFIQAEMWARKSQSHNHSKSFIRTEFPPILSQASKNKLRYRENRAYRSRIMMSNGGTIDSSDEEDYHVIDKKGDHSALDTQINLCLGMKPVQGVPESILAIGQSSSSESLDGSDSEDIDMFSFPELKRQATFCSTRELHKMYSIYQTQNCSSFKKAAHSRTEETFLNESATSSESTLDSRKGTFATFKSSIKEKWTSKLSLFRSREKIDCPTDTVNRYLDSPIGSVSKSSISALPNITKSNKTNMQSIPKGFQAQKSELERNSDYSSI